MCKGRCWGVIDPTTKSSWVNVELDLHTSKFQFPGERDSVPITHGWQLGKRLLAAEKFEEDYHRCQLKFYVKNSGEVNNHRPLHCQHLTLEMVQNTMSYATHSQRGIFLLEPLREVGL